MSTRKRIIIKSLILLLLVVAIIINNGGGNLFSKELSFSQLIDQGQLNELSLNIYYISPYILTLIPISANGLMSWNDVHIVINGSELVEHIDLIKQLRDADLIPVEPESPGVNARLYYVFESKTHRKVYDVCMWGADKSIFVNGVEVEGNDSFYDILWPFLPEDAVKELKNYLSYGMAGVYKQQKTPVGNQARSVISEW